MSSDPSTFDSFAILVKELPFDCDMLEFERALRAGMRSARNYLDDEIAAGNEVLDASYAGLIYSPVASNFGEVIAVVNLNRSPADRLVNAAAKVDWMLNNPGASMNNVPRFMPWLIGRGQFLWGHAALVCGFPGGGSGLSQENDRTVMEVILKDVTDGIRQHMAQRIATQRTASGKWSGDAGPRDEYKLILDDIAAETFTQVF